MKSFLSRAVLASVVLGVTSLTPAAQAAMISFSLTNFGSDDINVVVKLSDGADSADPGYLQIDMNVVPTVAMPNTGDIGGLFLGFNGEDADVNALVATIDALNAPQAATGGAWWGADVTDVFPGAADGCNNINGGPNPKPGSFMDIGFTLGVCGSSSGLLTSTTVYIKDVGIEDIAAFGARAQTVGAGPNGGGGSSKLYLLAEDFPDPDTPGDEIPEPATLSLMGAGLLGLMYFRRRKSS